MKVGYIGLGAMGGALARRLLVSRPLTVYDLNAGLMTDFEKCGATLSSGPGELARECDIVMLCLPRSANVRSVIFDDGGLIEGLVPGKTIIDQTSGDPAETRAMAEELAKRGIAMLDAPVSGGARGAEAGTISVMVGGERDGYEKAVPVFDQISPNHTYCGPIGSGQVLKLINNTISTCNRIALLEGVAVGLKNGINMETMTTVLNAGGARSKSSENLLPVLTEGLPRADFALALMLKDLNLATQLAIDSGAPMQSGQFARGLLQLSANMLGPDAKIDDIADVIAAQAGTGFPPQT
ncbi:NAD(P)-dependent oxidoreductase [uncultured Martelella sp.]|uniref:NAD(P)-dependent oxidoreductase n=1 Tax=uncultured Martelella sp. TaxID=392331 RepID=UPI0029C76B34|nr:NAD(P)-dependent oxidoreductase [uncultured Martelella sp.]